MTNNDIKNAYYDLITDLAKKINDLKGYESAYMLPSSGRILITHNGVNFMLTADILSTTDTTSLHDEMQNSKNEFILRHERAKNNIEEDINHEHD